MTREIIFLLCFRCCESCSSVRPDQAHVELALDAASATFIQSFASVSAPSQGEIQRIGSSLFRLVREAAFAVLDDLRVA